jgi:signal transduction histidine kinase
VRGRVRGAGAAVRGAVAVLVGGLAKSAWGVATAARGDTRAAADAVAALGRLVLDFRMLVLLFSLLALAVGPPVPGLTLAILVALFASFVPLMGWRRLAPWLMRHPLVLFADVVLTVGILLFTGVEGPFLYYTLGTAFLAGVLYGWVGGVLFPVTLVLGYLYVLELRAPLGDSVGGFQALIGVPTLMILAGVGAASIRQVLMRVARAEAALGHAAERARLAREMHDSLAKTLHGLALAAAALPVWIAREPDRAARDARSLAHAAQVAAGQASELIGDLRSDRLDTPLHETVRRYVDEWSHRTGIPVVLDADPVDSVGPSARYELFCILKEALRNVERHASATAAAVRLGVSDDGRVRLSVADDGVGLGPCTPDLAQLAADGHYGLVGMAERAQRAGGRLDVRPAHPTGVEILAEVAQ